MINLANKGLLRFASYAILPVLLFAIQSCISLKSEYPPIEYYRLNQEPTTFRNTATLEGSLQIRQFAVNEQLDSPLLTALTDENTVKRYYYHRWITDMSSLITDFFVTRLNSLRGFSGGVVKAGTIITPEYLLEGQLLEMSAYNAQPNDKNGSNVAVSVNINLIKRYSDKPEIELVLNKLYNIKIPRPSNDVKTIAPAFSKAFSEISDIMMSDIQEAIAKRTNN